MREPTEADLKPIPSRYQSARRLLDVLVGDDPVFPLLEAISAGDVTNFRRLLSQSPWKEAALESTHCIYSEDQQQIDANDVRGGLAKKGRGRKDPATKLWGVEHSGKGWKQTSTTYLVNNGKVTRTANQLGNMCARDEYPPVYLLGPRDPVLLNGGHDPKAQLVRYLPMVQNSGAGNMWAGACFNGILNQVDNQKLMRQIQLSRHKRSMPIKNDYAKVNVGINMDRTPVFSIAKWEHKSLTSDGIWDNTMCWPKAKAPQDPGWALLDIDPWNNNGRVRPYNFKNKYVAGQNGV